jgi:hypothetical protein
LATKKLCPSRATRTNNQDNLPCSGSNLWTCRSSSERHSQVLKEKQVRDMARAFIDAASTPPCYYRTISSVCSEDDTSDLADALRPLLKNNLAFDKNDWFPGRSPHSDCSVCAWVEDEDLPWDITEKEW